MLQSVILALAKTQPTGKSLIRAALPAVRTRNKRPTRPQARTVGLTRRKSRRNTSTVSRSFERRFGTFSRTIGLPSTHNCQDRR
jgi:hypothetical protein